MEITKLKQLAEVRQEILNRTAALNKKFKSKLVYQESLSDGGTRRPLFVINTKRECKVVREEVEAINELNAAILEFTERETTQLARPVILEDVDFVRVFENKSVSSRTTTSSRKDMLFRLSEAIKVASNINFSDSNRGRIRQLKKEWEWFNQDTEDLYRIRTFGTPDVITHIYFANGFKERVRITVGGVYLLNSNGSDIKINTPSHRLPRKKRYSIFDDIKPIPYSATLNASLYRESEVIAQKKRLGYDQDETINKVRRKQGKAKTEDDSNDGYSD